jgi:ppGpp synthetase/RelA/SpoT-type nucleotidyltranferase
LLGAAFSGADIVDRRASPSHGYRAVHVIVRVDGKPVEIQVRSLLQHRWAELSEKASDLVDPELKYGGGPRPVLERLTIDSQNVALYEECEERLTQIPQERHSEPEIRELHGALRFLRNALISSLDSTETMLAQVEGSGS